MKTMFYRLSLTALVLFISIMLTAQVQVSGRVIGNDIPGGIEGATVRLVGENDDHETQSGANGNFTFQAVAGNAAGINYQFSITYEGYQSHRSRRTVREQPLNIGVIRLNEYTYPPRDVTAEVSEEEDEVAVTWNEPTEWTPAWIHWDSGMNTNAIGTGEAYQFTVAARFTPINLNEMGVVGLYVTSIRFFPREDGALYTAKVWVGGRIDPMNPGREVFSFQLPQHQNFAWNEVQLNNPILIEGDEEIWIGYHINTPTGFPAGVDAGPHINNYGNLIHFGGSWNNLVNLNEELTFNWNLQAYAGVTRGQRSIAMSPVNPQDKQDDNVEQLAVNHTDNNTPLLISDPDNESSMQMFSDNLGSNNSRNTRLPGRQSQTDMERELEGYRVFRFNTLFYEERDRWVEMGTTEDTIFVDTTWEDVDEALYRYAVEAIYTGDLISPLSLSNEVSSLPPDFSGGDGTIFDPYIVATPHNLRSIGNYVGDEHNETYFVQTANIDLGGFPWDYGTGWQPIGSSAANSFQGSYDGDGFTISNLTLSRNGTNQGLFGYTNGALIENVVLDSVRVEAANNTGGLVGYAASMTTIKNCSVTSGSVRGTSIVGGLVGFNHNSTITGCSSGVDIFATASQSGGLVGNNFQGGKVIESYSSSNIQGGSYVGGLVGYNNGIRDEDCGTIIERSFSSGTVTGISNWIGGLTGRTFGSIIRDSYSSASVSAFNSFSGGLIGQHCCSSTLINSYAVGYTTSTAGAVGGLMGQQQTSTTDDSYWNRESTGQNIAPQGTSKSSAEMVQRNTFENWDFDDIWRINEGSSYPYFEWQENAWQHNIPGPFQLVGEAGDERVDLEWQAPPLGQVAGYRIYRNGVVLNPEDLVTQTEYADTTVVNFLTFTYQVSAIIGEETESAYSNPISVTPFVFEEGTGTQEDPYMITTAGQISIIRFNLDSHFMLANDVDLGIEPWNSGEGWNPIGTNALPFRGTLNGNGYKISNLTIDRSIGDFQGLFGATQNSQLRNVGMENVSINSRNYTGGLVGYARSTTISGSYVTGQVTGNIYTGGLVGYQVTNPNLISNSYNAADVHCTTTSGYVGGLVGYYHAGTLENSYSTGRVSFVGTTGFIGGLFGQTWTDVEITNSFWNVETSGQQASAGGGEGKTTAEMVQQQTFTEWNFDDVWNISFEDEDTYPYLRMYDAVRPHNYPKLIPPTNVYASAAVQNQAVIYWSDPSYGQPDSYNIYRDNNFIDNVNFGINQYINDDIGNLITYPYNVSAVYGEEESNLSNTAYVTPVPGGYAGGSGTAEDPYHVANSEQLSNVRHNRAAHYIQTEDIDTANIPNWTPIGSNSTLERFIGTYDGDEYEIRNLNINNPTGNYLGLFGFVGYGKGAVLRNITLRNINISGNQFIGGLAARTADNSLIENCYVIGDIESTSATTSVYIGGLVGYNHTTTIRNSYSSGSVEAENNFVGGLMGYSYNGTIENSYTTSNVEGGRYVGGFVGYHHGNIINSYARGAVSGTATEIAGFAGYTVTGNIINSYSTGRVSGPQDGENIGGFIGMHASGTITNCYWDTQTSGTVNSAAGDGRTTERMTFEYGADTYIDWDFDELWQDDRTGQLNDRYPYLYWYPLDISPNPTIALNPQPGNQANNIPRELENVRWTFNEHMLYSNPVGFRVYMNTTGVFGADAPYVWVPYIEDQENYSTAEVLPDLPIYGRTYYWRVVPTTIDPNERRRQNDSFGNRKSSNLSNRGDAQGVPTWRFTIENSPHPNTARNPQPANSAINVPLNLPVVAWTYISSAAFTNPVGFRVYMNESGEFSEDDDFIWVPYTANQSNYSTTDIMPEILEFNTTYHWKIVPTTDEPNRRTGRSDLIRSKIDGEQSHYHSPDRKRRQSGKERMTFTPTRGDAENVPVWSFTTRVSDPNPHTAHNPNPEHLATGISLGLSHISWEYDPIPGYAHPAGFRVYLNASGSFPGGSPFEWVPFTEDETEYNCEDILGFVLDPSTTYYWRVVPTTIDPTLKTAEHQRESRSQNGARDDSISQRNDAPGVVTWRFTTGTTDVGEIHELPLLTELHANYPNPFNPETTINFSLAEAGEVSIAIYNNKGQMVYILVDEFLNAGNHSYSWDGRDDNNLMLGSGIYFYRMKNGRFTSTNKMIMLK